MTALTAVIVLTLTGWLVGLTIISARRDSEPRPSRWVRMTTALLGLGTVGLAVPQLFLLVT